MKFPYFLIDLTHGLDSMIPTWDGGCGFDHVLSNDYDLSAEFKFKTHKIQMNEGIGTHMDSPCHCFPGKNSIEEIDLNELVAPCIKIDISDKANETYSLTIEDILEFETKYGKIPINSFVIIYTGWDKFWTDAKKYRNNYFFPSISKNAAEELVNREIIGLGIDTLSPDRPTDGFHVHNIVLGSNKFIVENIANARNIPNIGAFILIAPMKIINGSEAPIRLIAMTDSYKTIK